MNKAMQYLAQFSLLADSQDLQIDYTEWNHGGSGVRFMTAAEFRTWVIAKTRDGCHVIERLRDGTFELQSSGDGSYTVTPVTREARNEVERRELEAHQTSVMAAEIVKLGVPDELFFVYCDIRGERFLRYAPLQIVEFAQVISRHLDARGLGLSRT